jgi:hypothetical protein
MDAYNLENKTNLSENLPNNEQSRSTWLQQYQEIIDRGLAKAIGQVDRLLTAGEDCQIAGLLPETTTVSIGKKNGKCRAYIDLIHALLHCPEGLEKEIVTFNGDLIDSGLIKIMERMAANVAELGDRETANFLESCAKEVKRQSIGAEVSSLNWDNWTF